MKMTESISLSAKTVIMASLPYTKKDVCGLIKDFAIRRTTSIRNSNLFQAKM